MSLKIGQIRKNQYADSVYRTRLDKTGEINNAAAAVINLQYEDGKYYPTGYYSLPGGFVKGTTYHIKLNVALISGQYDDSGSDKINLKLVSQGDTAGEAGKYYMQIGTFTLWKPADEKNGTRVIEATFTPNFNYPYLVFELQRNGFNEDKRKIIKGLFGLSFAELLLLSPAIFALSCHGECSARGRAIQDV